MRSRAFAIARAKMKASSPHNLCRNCGAAGRATVDVKSALEEETSNSVSDQQMYCIRTHIRSPQKPCASSIDANKGHSPSLQTDFSVLRGFHEAQQSALASIVWTRIRSYCHQLTDGRGKPCRTSRSIVAIYHFLVQRLVLSASTYDRHFGLGD